MSSFTAFKECVLLVESNAFGESLAVLQEKLNAKEGIHDDTEARFLLSCERYLRKRVDAGTSDAANVYSSPQGFKAFIKGGGNVALYDSVENALSDEYISSASKTDRRNIILCDIGCGDGKALLGALSLFRDMLGSRASPISQVLLIEPASMLSDCVANLRKMHLDASIEEVASTVEAALDANADLFVGAKIVQSSFALHTLTREARAPVLSAIANSGATFLLVEFDCAGVDLAQRTSDNTLQYYFDKYVTGVAEYGDADDGSLTDEEKTLATDNFLVMHIFAS
jgi:hypothetical protein